MDDQSEVDFIKRAQIGLNDTRSFWIGDARSFWIGGSTDAADGTLLSLNFYKAGGSGD